MLAMKLPIATLGLACMLMLCAPVASLAENQKAGDTPQLTNWLNKTPTCVLKDSDVLWLSSQINQRTIRVANSEDIESWQAKASAKGNNNTVIDCGRTFVILDSVEMPDGFGALEQGWITFLIAADAPLPKVKRPQSPYYDLSNGNSFMAGGCTDGRRSGAGHSRACKFSE